MRKVGAHWTTKRLAYLSIWQHRVVPRSAGRLQSGPGGRHRSYDCYEDAGSDERHHHAAPESHVAVDQEAEHEATNEGADQAHDDVSDDAVAAALHHHPS